MKQSNEFPRGWKVDLLLILSIKIFRLHLVMRWMIGRVQHRRNAFSVAQMAVRQHPHSNLLRFTSAEYECIIRQPTFIMWPKCPWVFALHGDVCVGDQAPPDCAQGPSEKNSITSISPRASHPMVRRAEDATERALWAPAAPCCSRKNGLDLGLLYAAAWCGRWLHCHKVN